jgi:hypothetical protein
LKFIKPLQVVREFFLDFHSIIPYTYPFLFLALLRCRVCMFDNLSEKLNTVFKKLRGHGTLSEANIEEALKEVRMALLE